MRVGVGGRGCNLLGFQASPWAPMSWLHPQAPTFSTSTAPSFNQPDPGQSLLFSSQLWQQAWRWQCAWVPHMAPSGLWTLRVQLGVGRGRRNSPTLSCRHIHRRKPIYRFSLRAKGRTSCKKHGWEELCWQKGVGGLLSWDTKSLMTLS